jgi:hypothetical protein
MGPLPRSRRACGTAERTLYTIGPSGPTRRPPRSPGGASGIGRERALSATISGRSHNGPHPTAARLPQRPRKVPAASPSSGVSESARQPLNRRKSRTRRSLWRKSRRLHSSTPARPRRHQPGLRQPENDGILVAILLSTPRRRSARRAIPPNLHIRPVSSFRSCPGIPTGLPVIRPPDWSCGTPLQSRSDRSVE